MIKVIIEFTPSFDSNSGLPGYLTSCRAHGQPIVGCESLDGRGFYHSGSNHLQSLVTRTLEPWPLLGHPRATVQLIIVALSVAYLVQDL